MSRDRAFNYSRTVANIVVTLGCGIDNDVRKRIGMVLSAIDWQYRQNVIICKA